MKISESIAAKLLAIVFSIYFLVTLTITAIHMMSEYTNEKKLVLEDLEIFQDIFQAGLTNTLWQMDVDQLRLLLGGIQKSPIVVGVKVLDPEGTRVIGANANGIIIDETGKRVDMNSDGSLENQIFTDVFFHKFPLIHKETGRLLGNAVFYSSSRVVLEKVKYGFMLIVISAVIKTGALWIIFMIVSRSLLRQPLNIFTKATQELNLQNVEKFRIDIKTRGRNELKILEEAFNAMLGNLAHAREKILESNAMLEMETEKHKNTASMLAKSEARLKQFIGGIPVGVYVIDAEKAPLYANKTALGILGEGILSAEAERLIFPSYLDGMEKELPKEEWPIFKALDGSQHKLSNLEVRKGEEVVPVEFLGTPIFDEEGNVVYSIAAVVDITLRKKAEEEFKLLQSELMETARNAGMAEISSGILHNVGNVLTGIRIATNGIFQTLSDSRIGTFSKAVETMQEHLDDLGEFFTNDTKGKKVPRILIRLEEALAEEHERLLDDLKLIQKNLVLISDIVSTQQGYAKTDWSMELIELAAVAEDTLLLQSGSMNKKRIKIQKNFSPTPPVKANKSLLIHILVNLLKNADEALGERPDKRINIDIEPNSDQKIQLKIRDNGQGISKENLAKMFRHGFTTKSNGHGFGLHTCQKYMAEMDGEMSVFSEGEGKGAEFTLSFPQALLQTSSHS